ARPMRLKILGAALRHEANRQPGGIRADNRARAAMLVDASKEAALDGEVFGDGFDDPIRLRAPCKIVLEVSRRDQAGKVRNEERSRARFFRGFDARQREAVSYGGRFE